MTGDARGVAWMAAWNRIDAATKLRMDFRKEVIRYGDPLPPDYDALMREAEAFASLTMIDGSAAALAFAWLEEQRQEAEDRDRTIQEFLEAETKEDGKAQPDKA